MIEQMVVRRIFSVELSATREELIFTEACDEWFQTALTRAEVEELAADLLALAAQMPTR